jgi:argininosuccinate synthase
VSRKSPRSLYSLKIASFTMGAGYDQKDARGFINLTGLPIQVRARVDRHVEQALPPAHGQAEAPAPHST